MNSLSFKGFHTASAGSGLNVYKLTDRDREFTKKLAGSINLPKLMPGLSESQYQIWNDTMKKGLTRLEGEKLLLTQGSIPCGIMNYTGTPYKFNVNYTATWPAEAGKRVPFAGKTLFLELFNRFLKSNAQIVELLGIKYAPFDPVGKYLELGFKMYGGDNYHELMRTNREQVCKTTNRFRDLIKLKSIENSEDVDLSKIYHILQLPHI